MHAFAGIVGLRLEGNLVAHKIRITRAHNKNSFFRIERLYTVFSEISHCVTRERERGGVKGEGERNRLCVDICGDDDVIRWCWQWDR